MSINSFDELEEALDELFPGGFSIATNKHGELIIRTGLIQNEDGELSSIDVDEEDDDADPDFEPLSDDDDEE